MIALDLSVKFYYAGRVGLTLVPLESSFLVAVVVFLVGGFGHKNNE